MINRLIGSGEDPGQIVRVLADALFYVPVISGPVFVWECPPSECDAEIAKMHANAALLLSTMGQHDVAGSVSAFANAIERYAFSVSEENTLINSLRGILISIPDLAQTLIDPASGKEALRFPDLTARAILAVKNMAQMGPTPAVRRFAQEIQPKLSELMPGATVPMPPVPTAKFPTGPVVFAFGLIAAIGALIFYADSMRD